MSLCEAQPGFDLGMQIVSGESAQDRGWEIGRWLGQDLLWIGMWIEE